MKRKSIYRILAILFTATIFFAACKKDDTNVKLDPKLSTTNVSNVTSDGATVVGFVVAQGSGFTERGVCYNTVTLPTVTNSKTIYTGSTSGATFNVTISGLAYATKYYVRAYGTDANGATVYGEEFNFTTSPVIPTLSTTEITEITGNTATGGGMVLAFGGDSVTVQGICYSQKHEPTTADSKTADGKAPVAFVSKLTNLKGNSIYYVRAYATNSAGTGYGPEITFRTVVDVPALVTDSITQITKVSAIAYSRVTYDGGGVITARGLAWGLNADPTIAENNIAGGSGLGSFTSKLAGLTEGTAYHVRAYATNSAGTSYGTDVKFSTIGDILTWDVPGDYLVASYPGSTYANWAPANSPVVMSTLSAPKKLEGYVYMAQTTNNWKFTSFPDWTHTNYGLTTGAGNERKLNTDPTAGNLTSPKGYYRLTANADSLTFDAVATVWGVIGDATPIGWDDETPLTYIPATRKWTGTVHLKAGSFKFRANHSWSYNYGSTAGDATLNFDGANIPLIDEGDYVITLDLSHPNAYTYTAVISGKK